MVEKDRKESKETPNVDVEQDWIKRKATMPVDEDERPQSPAEDWYDFSLGLFVASSVMLIFFGVVMIPIAPEYSAPFFLYGILVLVGGYLFAKLKKWWFGRA